MRNVVKLVGVALLMVAVPACSSSAKHSAAASSATGASSSSSPAPAPSSQAATVQSSSAPAAGTSPATAGGGASNVTFDGAYTGTLKIVQCVGTGSATTASVEADYASGDKLPGNVSAMEFGFEGPANTQFDSGFQKNPLDVNGSGFKLDGLTVTDPSAGKTLTMHGTLHCP